MKPILFNTEMVRAILDGRKTVTRRVVKPQPPATSAVSMDGPYAVWWFWEDDPSGHLIKPPYKQGDILYVRETWAHPSKAEIDNGAPANMYLYYADAPLLPCAYDRWRPSIHMQKEAARLFLRVTDVRVERLQDITDAGAIGEGIYQVAPDVFINGGKWTYERSPAIGYVWTDGTRNCFRWGLWDTTIKTDDLPLYGWDANPWVWVIEFKRISKEEAYENE